MRVRGIQSHRHGPLAHTHRSHTHASDKLGMVVDGLEKLARGEDGRIGLHDCSDGRDQLVGQATFEGRQQFLGAAPGASRPISNASRFR